ncbi:MAG: flavin reductase family protein [Desulfovibrio sp.]|uniref:flavin reductase family protein n=1 Tax=Hydrogenophaga sp. TaxID=1904254 RepID=UPI0027219D71|nr:flavin reductase family protein [Hydrogenophaga sp.]MBA4356931.1 flavin reductase family protein [Desulfovibrio sp.]MDO9032419.1 flavin reductase family protein [Hydrogenophaga sp.]
MKRNLGPVNALYPSLTTIVGAVVDGRPNFLTVAHVGIMNHGQPQYLSFGINKTHHTNQGIHTNREFSVCIPGEDLVVETDYVGLVTGKNTDKSQVFDLFQGQLAFAPLIQGCPVCMECRLARVIDFAAHDVFIGEIVATHADESVLRPDGTIDIALVRPLLFDMASITYWSLGAQVAPCWNVGKELKSTRRSQAQDG